MLTLFFLLVIISVLYIFKLRAQIVKQLERRSINTQVKNKHKVEFDLKPVGEKPRKSIKYNLTPVSKKQENKKSLKPTILTKEQILYWSQKYDQEHPWWSNEEKRIRAKIHSENLFGLDILKDIIHWKFYTIPWREKRILNYIQDYTDIEIRSISSKALTLPIKDEKKRIKHLSSIKGIGVSLASTVLTFYDPTNYGIYDIHVMRGVYRKKPKYMFKDCKYYLQLLKKLRKLSKEYQLPVRLIEKAYFKMDLDSG